MTRRPVFAPALAVVVLLVGHLAALHHQAEVVHVTCEEHGEQLDASRLSGDGEDSADDRWVGLEGEGGDHHDCAIARLLRMCSTASESVPDHLVSPISTTIARTAARSSDISVEVLLIAPKTSPPV